MNIDLNTEEMRQVVHSAIKESIHDLFHPTDHNEQIDMGLVIREAIIDGIDKALCTGPHTMQAIEMGMKRGVEESMQNSLPVTEIIEQHLEAARNGE